MRMRPMARFLVRIQSHRHCMFLCFKKLPEPTVGAIVHCVGTDRGKPTILTGAVVTLHSGVPDVPQQPMCVNWKLIGEMVDTRTRPWTVVRRVQLSQAVAEGPFQLVDPERGVFYDVEIIYWR